MADRLVTPVILCGGAGTRLWPVSREKMPKQFALLIGTSSSFQQVLTCEGLFAPPMIIVAEQARARGVKAAIILEPQRRDSAAAIAAAAELAVKKHPAPPGDPVGRRRGPDRLKNQRLCPISNHCGRHLR
jgi:mannose-1-phosphate guanylyltransferase / mannose-6-phosphate isomerase